MTIQSTCHPHSQAASSSLLTNEGGGVGEADAEGVVEEDRHTDAGKETGTVARPKARPRAVNRQTGEGRRRQRGSGGSEREQEAALTPGRVA